MPCRSIGQTVNNILVRADFTWGVQHGIFTLHAVRPPEDQILVPSQSYGLLVFFFHSKKHDILSVWVHKFHLWKNLIDFFNTVLLDVSVLAHDRIRMNTNVWGHRGAGGHGAAYGASGIRRTHQAEIISSSISGLFWKIHC